MVASEPAGCTECAPRRSIGGFQVAAPAAGRRRQDRQHPFARRLSPDPRSGQVLRLLPRSRVRACHFGSLAYEPPSAQAERLVPGNQEIKFCFLPKKWQKARLDTHPLLCYSIFTGRVQ
jgi:hypothetical protein